MSDKVQVRNAAILNAAVELAGERGWRNFSRADVAARAGVAAGSVNNAYETMDGLHDAVADMAVLRRLPRIVAGALAAGHPRAREAPQDLKDQALATLAAA